MPGNDAGPTITTGVLGATWRASVTPWGSIRPWDGSAELGWSVAADDRWHVPADEPSVRQRRVDATAVVETRLRVPRGDVVQTVYSIADAGGLTVVEVVNESPLPVVVAFTRSDVLTSRPPTVPVGGPHLPAGTIALPVGHRSSVSVALAHRPGAVLPAVLPGPGDVARGWSTVSGCAGRAEIPDVAEAAASTAARCELLLGGPPAIEDPVGFLLGVDLLVRMGGLPGPWVGDVAAATEAVARRAPRDWLQCAALDAAERTLAVAGEQRAADDVARVRSTVAGSGVPTGDRPVDPLRSAVWNERRLVGSYGALLPAGLPADWRGANFEVFDMPSGRSSTVSFALRWHGERPAVLWEQHGNAVELTAPAVAPGWSTREMRGEALWPAP